jgi:hypothetical protein
MIDEKVVNVMAQAFDGWEEKILENFALSVILAQLGSSATEIDDAVRKVLAQPDVKREAKKQLFRYRAIREDIERYLSEKHGAVLPPPQKVN